MPKCPKCNGEIDRVMEKREPGEYVVCFCGDNIAQGPAGYFVSSRLLSLYCPVCGESLDLADIAGVEALLLGEEAKQ